MQYCRSKTPGATFFFTVVTYRRNKILCHEANVALIKEAFLLKHRLVNSPIEWPYSSFHRYVKQGDYGAEWGAGNKIEFDAKVGYE